MSSSLRLITYKPPEGSVGLCANCRAITQRHNSTIYSCSPACDNLSNSHSIIKLIEKTGKSGFLSPRTNIIPHPFPIGDELESGYPDRRYLIPHEYDLNELSLKNFLENLKSLEEKGLSLENLFEFMKNYQEKILSLSFDERELKHLDPEIRKKLFSIPKIFVKCYQEIDHIHDFLNCDSKEVCLLK